MTSFGPIGRFHEGPRWRDGRWWVSDMTDRVISVLSPSGAVEEKLVMEDRPSGLGWLDDGSLLVVGMDRRTLLRFAPGASEPSLYADLRPLCGDMEGHLNDMVVTPDGHAYVGFDPDFAIHGFQSDAGAILHVDPSGQASLAATGLHFPNGMVVTANNVTLIVAETGSPRLTAFSRRADGALGERRIWADLSACADRRADRNRTLPLEAVGLDGCAIDAEGRVWASNSNSPACFLVGPGNVILDAVFIPDRYRCLACALGGDERQTLLLCGFDLSKDHNLATSTSKLFTIDLSSTARTLIE